jgi:hypothetical protein
MNGRIAVTVVDHRGERHVLSLHPNTVLAQVRRMLEKLLRVPASTIRASTSLPWDIIRACFELLFEMRIALAKRVLL